MGEGIAVVDGELGEAENLQQIQKRKHIFDLQFPEHGMVHAKEANVAR